MGKAGVPLRILESKGIWKRHGRPPQGSWYELGAYQALRWALGELEDKDFFEPMVGIYGKKPHKPYEKWLRELARGLPSILEELKKEDKT